LEVRRSFKKYHYIFELGLLKYFILASWYLEPPLNPYLFFRWFYLRICSPFSVLLCPFNGQGQDYSTFSTISWVILVSIFLQQMDRLELRLAIVMFLYLIREPCFKRGNLLILFYASPARLSSVLLLSVFRLLDFVLVYFLESRDGKWNFRLIT